MTPIPTGGLSRLIDALGRHQTNHHKPMDEYFLEDGTYTASVLDHTDRNGNLTLADAKQLLAEHGKTLMEANAEGVDFYKLRHAVTLLAHLGY